MNLPLYHPILFLGWELQEVLVAGLGLGEVGPEEVDPGEPGPVRVGPVRMGPVRMGPVRVGPVRVGPVRALLIDQSLVYRPPHH